MTGLEVSRWGEQWKKRRKETGGSCLVEENFGDRSEIFQGDCREVVRCTIFLFLPDS